MKICTFSFQICFRNQFLTFGSGQTENTQICIFVYTLIHHFPKSKLILKADLKREGPYFFSNFFNEFWPVFKKVKEWISHCIFKKWFDWRRVFFMNFFSEKAKHPKICLSLGGSMPEAQIKQCPLTPSPTSMHVNLMHLGQYLLKYHHKGTW